MALRLCTEILHGELENRHPGRTTGILHLVDHKEPLTLDLVGNPWRDLAGHRVVFKNPNPGPAREAISRLVPQQTGCVGDITASRKVKVLDCPLEALPALHREKRPIPHHWANSLYLEWFGDTNGRIVVEATGFEISIDPEPAWTMTPEDETAQHEANRSAMLDFANSLGAAFADGLVQLPAIDESDDEPQSRLEAEADSEAARMNLLLDRIQARMLREDADPGDFDEIWDEERERLRIERGEPEPPPLTPEQEATMDARIDELNALANEAIHDQAENPSLGESEDHPLVEKARDLAISMHHAAEAAGWIPEGSPPEHPLNEAWSCIATASSKLAGALNIHDPEDWPPEPLFAGHALHRLKTARRFLRDALLAIETAAADHLAPAEWTDSVANALTSEILPQLEHLITEVRLILNTADQHPEFNDEDLP
ncbi:MAG: hypothetical protein ACKOHM_10385 [Spartobacteria bacterium]